MSKNPVSWWELASKDALSTVNFLNKVFDWGLQPGKGNYYEFLAGGNTANGFYGGGIYTADKGTESCITLYIAVDDVDATAKLIESSGGTIIEAPFDVPHLGRLCMFREPNGQMLAIIKRVF